MTKEDAIRWLEDIHRRFNPTGENLENEGGDVHLQALDMAIEALSTERTGEWIENAPEGQDIDPPYICSICGHAESTRTPFCEQCGAKMKGGTENE